MFLKTSDLFFALSIPFVLIVGLATLIVAIYLVYLVIEVLSFNSRKQFKEMFNLFVSETVNIPDYEPAIMAYLVNMQKIGRREICSTLFDLIGKGKIKIDLLYGSINSNSGEYRITLLNKEKLNKYETLLINYLFRDKLEINEKDLSNKLYKENLDKKFYSEFLKGIQEEAKEKDFFSKSYAKWKMKTYKIINKIVTLMASIASVMFGIIGLILEGSDGDEFTGSLFIWSLISALILWILKFIVTFTFNLTCYYNEFSKQGNEDYKKWKGFKKYLKHYSEIPNHPIMGVLMWEKYYAYSIGLKVSKKFYKQMKKMKIVDNSIDIELFSMFNEIIECIGVSKERMKSISLDKYGGSHVDY